jgi:hypothetical protein
MPRPGPQPPRAPRPPFGEDRGDRDVDHEPAKMSSGQIMVLPGRPGRPSPRRPDGCRRWPAALAVLRAALGLAASPRRVPARPRRRWPAGRRRPCRAEMPARRAESARTHLPRPAARAEAQSRGAGRGVLLERQDFRGGPDSCRAVEAAGGRPRGARPERLSTGTSLAYKPRRPAGGPSRDLRALAASGRRARGARGRHGRQGDA